MFRDNRYLAGPASLHISADSPFISRHHTNWRMQAVQSLDRANREDLHYSLVMSISPKAAEKIREILLQSLEASEVVLREAKDEAVYALTLDLFALSSGKSSR